ncbi:MAG: response regulator [Leptospiraceae bacterium]|nr:response regulator [Leptospiraceae bacterium]MDW8305672.1 response regulator [Leptospiraceae bacterium]
MGFLKDRQILLLEDSPLTAKFLKEVIEKEDGTAIWYDDLERFDVGKEPYDLVFADFLIKGKTSAELVSQLKKHYPHLHIILHTAHSLTSPEIEKNRHLYSAILKKPASAEAVLQVIRRHLKFPLQGIKALILEDARVSLQAMTRILEELGATVFAFSDIEEKKILAQSYDLAILDIYIGEKKSLSLIPKLKVHNPGLIVLVISSSPNALLEEPIAESLVSYIAQKPITDKQFRSIILEICGAARKIERRKEIRIEGRFNCWLARFDRELNKAGVFESPYLVDMSRGGMSFQSFFQYEPNEEILIWFLPQEQSQELLEMRGTIRWKNEVSTSGIGKIYAYGVEFRPQLSPGFQKWENLIAQHQ